MKNNTAKNLVKIGNAIDPLFSQKTPSGIRKFLAKGNFKGKIASGSSCPISNYLRKSTDIDGISIDSFSMTFGTMEIFNTIPIKEFVINFDAGKYPELVAK